MKKSIIALMSIFALVSCSEDSYEAKDNSTPNPSFENTVKTTQQNLGLYGYYSPYTGSVATGFNSPYNLNFEFDIQAPVDRVQITPYVGVIYRRQHELQLEKGNSTYIPNFLQYAPAVNAIETLTPLSIPHGFTLIKEWTAAIPVFPGGSCPTVPFIFDYGLPSTGYITVANESTILAENSKIYLIEYKFDLFGQTYTGMLRHQLGDDTMRLSDYTSNGWSFVSDFPKLNSSPYDEVVVVSSNVSGEMALAQRNTATNPLNSELTVTDPGTGTDYTLRFRNEANRIVIEFKQ